MTSASALVIGGVSGCGKSTVARAVAAKVGAQFIDADDLHAEESIQKMKQGEPLTDSERQPWLRKVTEVISRADGPTVVACSALRRSYRDVLRHADKQVFFVVLSGDRRVLLERMRGRTDHFMPAELLDSQLDTLEDLARDELGEYGLVLDIELPLEKKLSQIIGWWAPRERRNLAGR